MKLTCLQCGAPYDLPEGAEAAKAVCPTCGTPQNASFPYAKFVRFESAGNPAYLRACEAARRGDRDAAFAALDEALKADYDLFDRAAADPVFAPLRSDARWAPLLKRRRVP